MRAPRRWDDLLGNGQVGQHPAVGLVLDRLDLLGSERRRAREVEPHPLGRDERSSLPYVVANPFPQDRVQNVGHRVVALDVRAALGVDRRAHRRSCDHLRGIAVGQLGHRDKRLSLPPHVDDPEAEPFAIDRPGVRHLPSARGVERILVQADQETGVGCVGHYDCRLDR